MGGIFATIETARRAMSVCQEALAVSAHNVANASAEGYSKQRAVVVSKPPPAGLGLLSKGPRFGGGVEVAAVTRIRDGFLDAQIRTESSRLGYYSTLAQDLRGIEAIINEPSEGGLAASMQDLWDAFQELSLNPESAAARTSVLEEVKALGDAFEHLRTQLRDLMSQIESRIGSAVEDVNSSARELSILNGQIHRLAAAGRETNDLVDRRDALLDELSRFGRIRCVYKESGAVTVHLGDGTLVSGTCFQTLEVCSAPSGDVPGLSVIGLKWSESGASADVGMGHLEASLRVRNSEAPSAILSLGALACAIRDELNAIHSAGYGLDDLTGMPLFDPAAPGASSTGSDMGPWGMKANPALDSSPGSIAAASGPSKPGDGSNALKMAQVGTSPSAGLGGTAPGEYHRSMCVGLGIVTREALSARENEEVLVGYLQDVRESHSGVYTDEEAAEMLRLEKAYQAAARLFSVADRMVEILLEIGR